MKEKALIITLDRKVIDELNKEDISLERDSVNLRKYYQPETYNPNLATIVSLLQNMFKKFSQENIAFYTPQTILEGEDAFEFRDGYFQKTDPLISADALLIFSVDSRSSEFGINYIEKQYESYGKLSSRIGKFMNPLNSKFLLDKKRLYDVGDELLPRMYSSKNWDEVDKSVQEQGKVVLKHRMGAEGDQVHLLEKNKSYEDIKLKVGESLGEYILQDYIDIQQEKRLIIFGNEMVAARIVDQRNFPWDDQSRRKDGYKSRSYNPSEKEKRLALELHNDCGLDYSAVDFVETPKGSYLLELNGTCPGLVAAAYPDNDLIYNVGEEFANFVHNSVCKEVV